MRFVEIRRNEGVLVVASTFYSILLGVPRAFTFTVAITVFLQAWGPGFLPWAYAGGALVVAALGLLYVVLQRRFGLRWVAVGTYVVFVAVCAAAVGALRAELFVGPIAFALVIFAEAELTLGHISFWNFANQTFTVRQAGRLFGFVSAGQSLPAIVGGLAIPWLVQSVQIELLLMGSIVGHGMAAIWAGLAVPFLLPTSARSGVGPSGDRDDAESPTVARRTEPVSWSAQLQSLMRDPLLRWVTVLLCLQVFVFFAVDNAFYIVLESELGDGPRVAAFLGRFLVALGLLGLIFRLAFSGRWRHWFGLRSALISTPATLIVLASLTLLLTAVGIEPSIVFGLMVVLKLWERIAVDAVHGPSYYALFLPLPLEDRASAQSMLESVVAQAATLLTSVLLLVLQLAPNGARVGLLLAVVVASLLWAATCVVVSIKYRTALQKTLVERRIEPGALPVADTTTLDLIREGARSDEPLQVLRSLAILEEMGGRGLDDTALHALRHQDARVLIAAAKLLERRPCPSYASSILERFERGASDDASAALLRAYGACAREAAVPTLEAQLSGPLQLQSAASSVLMQHGGRRGYEVGLAAADRLVDADSASLRCMGARVLGVRPPTLQTTIRLVRLLGDPEPTVARAAAEAIGRGGGGFGLEGALLAAADRPGLALASVEALSRLPAEAVVPAAEIRLSAPMKDSELLTDRLLLQTLSRLEDPTVDDLLRRLCASSPRRHAALVGMSHRASAAPDTADLLAVLGDEMARGLQLRIAGWDAGDPNGGPSTITQRVLQDELADTRDRILLLAGLAFDATAIHEARQHLANGSAETMDLALELVEAALPESLAGRLLPLLDTDVTESTLSRLLDGGPLWPRNWPDRRRVLLEQDFALPWLSAALRAEADPAQGSLHIDSMAALMRVPVLERLRTEQIDRLARRAKVDFFEAGQTIVTEGASVVAVALDEARPPWPCDLDLLFCRPVAKTLRSEQSGRWLCLERNDLDELFEDAPDAAWRILEHLCRRNRDSDGPATHPQVRAAGQRVLPYSELLRLMAELERVPELSQVSSRMLAAVARSARERRYPTGATLIEEGRVESTLFLLVQGEAVVSKGGEFVARLAAPTLFGELAAIVPAPRSASIVADRPCYALEVPREALYSLMLDERAIVHWMLDLVVGRLKA